MDVQADAGFFARAVNYLSSTFCPFLLRSSFFQQFMLSLALKCVSLHVCWLWVCETLHTNCQTWLILVITGHICQMVGYVMV